VESSASGAFPFMRTTSGLVSGVARRSCGWDRVCLPLKATIDRAGSPQWSHHNGFARCTATILIILIFDAPPESTNCCHSAQGKSSTSSAATAPEILVTEVTPGLLVREEPDAHQFYVRVCLYMG
jgi:hypothetical protein